MAADLARMFEDVRHEPCLVLLLSLADQDIMRQSEFTDYGIDILKKISFRETSSATNFERTRSHVLIGIKIRLVCFLNKWLIQIQKMKILLC